MRESSETLDTIERYTKGKMNLEEKLAFEKELASNESLREQLAFSQIVDQMIIGNEALKLKGQMQKDLRKPKSRVWTYLAVSLFVMTTCAGLFVVFSKKEDKPKVASPVSIASKTTKEEEKQVALQKPNIPTVTKTATVKEKKTSAQGQSITSEFKEASVQPAMVQDVSVPVSTQAVDPTNAVSKQSLATTSKVDPCASLVGDVEFYTSPSCKGQETGEVHLKVETVKGGLAPFTFKLGEKSAKNNFYGLASGQYSLFIKDANDCTIENRKKVIVGEKKCAERKEYVFNPEYDQSWPIPYDHEKVASNFKILEKGGKVFFQTSVSASHPIEWRGESNTGLVLGMGLYFFAIEYADGSVDEGSIVVTR